MPGVKLEDLNLEVDTLLSLLCAEPEKRVTWYNMLQRDYFSQRGPLKLYDTLCSYKDAGLRIPDLQTLKRNSGINKQLVDLLVPPAVVLDVEAAVDNLDRYRRRRLYAKMAASLNKLMLDEELAREEEDDTSAEIGALYQMSKARTQEAGSATEPNLRYKDSGHGRTALRAIKQVHDKRRGTKIGWPTFDDISRGLRAAEGQLIMIAGNSGSGKSVAAMQIGMNMARNGERVKMVSLEMTKEEISLRMVAHNSGCDHDWLRNPDIPEADKRWAFEADNLWRMNTPEFEYIHPEQSYTAWELMDQAVAEQRTVLIIDHMLLCKEPPGRTDTWDKLYKATQYIKQQATKHGMTVFLITQLSDEGTLARSKQMIQHVTCCMIWEEDDAARATDLLTVHFVKRLRTGAPMPDFQIKRDLAHMRLPEATKEEIAAGAEKLAKLSIRSNDEGGYRRMANMAQASDKYNARNIKLFPKPPLKETVNLTEYMP